MNLASAASAGAELRDALIDSHVIKISKIRLTESCDWISRVQISGLEARIYPQQRLFWSALSRDFLNTVRLPTQCSY